MENYFEQLARTKQQMANIEKDKNVQGERKEEMEIDGFEDLPKLFISPIEKSMDEFKGSVKEFRGLFKVPKENTTLVSINTLHQQICITSKDQFGRPKGNAIYLVWIFHKMNKFLIGCREQKTIKSYNYPIRQKDL